MPTSCGLQLKCCLFPRSLLKVAQPERPFAMSTSLDDCFPGFLPARPALQMGRCSHDSCKKQPSFKSERGKKTAYCKQHAKAGMTNFRSRHCLFESCSKTPSFNYVGLTAAVYCKQHAEDGMVDVRSRRCSHDGCTKQSNFNVESSSTPLYCKAHAEDGMVNVCARCCLYDSCNKRPTLNHEGSTTPILCKQHAEEGMVDVTSRRCSHDSCTKWPAWGVATDGAATVCPRHMSDILDGYAINFRAVCKVAGCTKLSRWGLNGEQPTHCPEHGALDDGLVCTVSTTRNQKYPSCA